MVRSLIVTAAGLFGLVAGSAAAQTAPVPSSPPVAQSQATPLGDVVVEGRRGTIEDTVRSFVDDVLAPPPGRGPARWDRTVCVGAVNLRPAVAQVLIDRISRIALDVGLEPGEPGCKPNVLVIVTADGQSFARGLVQARRRAFLPGVDGSSGNAEDLEAFQNSDRAVRWWHVSLPVTADTGAPAVRIPGYDPPQISALGSRLSSPIRNDLRRVFIIVDVDKVGSVTFQQLGDYVGMVALAQINPNAQTTGYNTVLNLFSNPDSVDGLTDWDRDYLRSLYSAELNQRSPNAQSGEIGSTMTQERQRPDDADGE